VGAKTYLKIHKKKLSCTTKKELDSKTTQAESQLSYVASSMKVNGITYLHAIRRLSLEPSMSMAMLSLKTIRV